MIKNNSQKIPKALSIAGFDGSGGAGIQADLKTFSALGCYGMTVLTALPIQNTCGVRRCYEIPLQAISDQLEAIFDDILPDAIKIGMLFSSDIIELVADFLKANAKTIPIVLDPVMISKSGSPLLLREAIHVLKEKLIPLTTIITPNLPEAYTLINTLPKEELIIKLNKLGSQAVLLKGGHEEGINSIDTYLDTKGTLKTLISPRIKTNNSHGTGCTLSAAITSFLARGYSLIEACENAKTYLYQSLDAGKDFKIGKGQGPVHHFSAFW